MNDDLGDRMKEYEGAEADRRLMPLLPVMARLDGKNFSTFTRGLERPYDSRMSSLMEATTEHLVKTTGACCGYTQSDEITLAWYSPSYKSEIWFDGRVQKMCSVLAGLTSALFNRGLPNFIPEKALWGSGSPLPVFDCRVWNVPNITEGANTFLWRELDASKNSVSMAARHYFSHKELMNKSCKEMQEMLFTWHKVNWNDYPDFFRRGTYLQRHKVLRKFTAAELADLPAQHEAHKNPALEVERSEIRRLNMPKLSTVTNREEVLFFGAEPQTASLVQSDIAV